MKTKKLTIDKIKETGFVWSIMTYPVILFIIFYVYVNFNSIIMAFQQKDFLGNVVKWVGFNNFRQFITDLSKSPVMSTALKNSIILYSVSIIITLPFQLIFSYYLFKKIPCHGFIRFVIMLPSIISSFVICLVFKKFVEGVLPSIAKQLGNQNFPNLFTDIRYTFATCVFYEVWMSFSSILILYSNAMNQIDGEILESAKVDGIREGLQELFYIVLPLIFPTLTTFLVCGVGGLVTSSGPLVGFFMFNAPQVAYTIGYYYYIQVASTASQISYPYLAAGGLIMTCVVAPLTFGLKYVLEKYGPNCESN